MTPEDRKLMQQLRDALVRSNNALNVLTATNHQHDAEIIAAADARLAAPVQSHEAWVEQMMGIVTHISELHSRYVNYNTKALHDTWTAKKDELHAHLRNHPAVVPEGFVLVPVEPTEAMIESARLKWNERMQKRIASGDILTPKPDAQQRALIENYKAMIAAKAGGTL